ncbi:MAG: hypothetical protein ACRD96_09975 [Bryobacteraceae bacterium]
MRLIAVFLMVSAAVSAQERGQRRKLESVTWDLTNHKLVWTVNTGSVGADGNFEKKATEKFEITPDDAVMSLEGERRGFTRREAEALHQLLDVLAVYCAESVDWWERGEGEPADGKPGNTNRHHEAPPKNKKAAPDRTAEMRAQLVALLARASR